MTVGDPKKAGVLGAVAIIVVSVAVFRSIPSGPPPQAANPNANSPAANAAVTPPQGQIVVDTTSVPETKEGTSTTLLNDPFAHPAKQGVVKPTKPAEKPAVEGRDRAQTSPSPRLSRSGTTKPFNPFKPGQSIGSLPNTSENTGNGQVSDTGVKIVLKAVVSLKEAEALISINDNPALRGRKGTLFGEIEVVSVGEGHITIRFGKKYHRVRVGEVVIL